ncbi:hypothetical protein H4R26_004115 [Coemansia thaxteri]|uniref:Uncharacterized protein n=1 Tax=Coemansia thaxteri TaxID=2663907 RepID=A0A9W8EH13_9FUNG|nr:hypothetical protein H4R26_004115 [Coemansia thaxteri]KAJ2480340.1 hypothetical protein EV174_003758 [Coemansia sp. RSA 2320]
MIGLPDYVFRLRQQNDAVDCSNKHGLIVGGTRGLGAAAAERLAGLGASITIVGRTAEAGRLVLENCRARSPNSTAAMFNMITGDLSLLAEVDRIASDVADLCQTRKVGIDFVVFTAGCYGSSAGWTMLSSTTRTSEDIDYWFSLLYLSRHLLIQRILPLLELSTAACVVNVFRAGSRASLDLNNLGLSGKGNLETISSIGLYIDAMTISLAQMHNSIEFYHLGAGPMVPYPVVENTTQLPALAWLARTLQPWLYAQSPLASEAAEAVVSLTVEPHRAVSRSGALMSYRLECVPPTQFIQSPDTLERIWQYTKSLLSHRGFNGLR